MTQHSQQAKQHLPHQLNRFTSKGSVLLPIKIPVCFYFRVYSTSSFYRKETKIENLITLGNEQKTMKGRGELYTTTFSLIHFVPSRRLVRISSSTAATTSTWRYKCIIHNITVGANVIIFLQTFSHFSS
jgi:hypothetical protein